ncbi:type 1 glutamine amidotransferase [Cohnella laeviribosi]|uniref:type 1 glutamine amidotransferase n=1 Tax=Cohnella laeviribosi TaxID=380174 RepID=UPI00036930F1|nr:type 1 glutamine amidotransferase [Cohnella laeviribosi]
MRLLLLKHFSFDDESAIVRWAEAKRFPYAVMDPSGGGPFPDMAAFDLLIVMGGPMSVYEESEYPWLRPEKTFIRQAIASGKAILGICLGGQMLAELLGGRVYRNKQKEIGFHPIERTDKTHPLLDGLPNRFYSFQWHGDAFDLPAGAVRLAFSEACANQAFAFGPHILGLQFHLETTAACMEAMLKRWSDQIRPAPYIQTAEQIRAQAERIEASHRMLHRILDAFDRLNRQRQANLPLR